MTQQSPDRKLLDSPIVPLMLERFGFLGRGVGQLDFDLLGLHKPTVAVPVGPRTPL